MAIRLFIAKLLLYKFQAYLIGTILFPKDQHNKKLFIKYFLKSNQVTYLKLLRDMKKVDYRQKLKNIDQKILFIAGANDQIIPIKYQRKISDFIKNINFITFPGGHVINIDASLNSQENKLLFFASLFGRRQKSLVGLKVLIKGLQPSLVFECFSCVEYKISIPVKYRIQLSSSILDNRVMLGNKYYKAGGIVTIHLYELQLQQWQDILNKTNKWQQFFNMLRCYLGCSQLCKVVIYLAAGQASAVKLHDKKTGLGRNSWLLSSANLEYSVLPKKFMLPI